MYVDFPSPPIDVGVRVENVVVGFLMSGIVDQDVETPIKRRDEVDVEILDRVRVGDVGFEADDLGRWSARLFCHLLQLVDVALVRTLQIDKSDACSSSSSKRRGRGKPCSILSSSSGDEHVSSGEVEVEWRDVVVRGGMVVCDKVAAGVDGVVEVLVWRSGVSRWRENRCTESKSLVSCKLIYGCCSSHEPNSLYVHVLKRLRMVRDAHEKVTLLVVVSVTEVNRVYALALTSPGI